MKIVFKMLVGFAKYFLVVYLFLFLGGVIAAYFIEDFPSVNIETCIIAGLVGNAKWGFISANNVYALPFTTVKLLSRDG